MSDKAKLPKEVAEVAASINHLGDTMFDLETVRGYLSMTSKDVLDNFLVDPNHDGYRIWFSALVNGYEVIEEPITKTFTSKQIKDLKNYREELLAGLLTEEKRSYQFSHQLDAFKTTLNILGMAIEGNT